MDNQILDLDGISPRRRRFDRLVVQVVEKLVRFIVTHWLALANLSTFLLIFLSGLAPYLMSIGLSAPARTLYLFFKFLCHDIPSRHYYVFGNRMTLDHRSLAIYAAVLGMGLIFALVRGHLKPLNWRIFVLLCAPMAIDGFTQLFGFRESNWILRTITGALFGIAAAWLVLPYMELGMRDARADLLRG
ncbi:MAG: DUF2085 domain-containing protein [Dehalococcoidia bacterium]|nr:DUF2085 domain-containing protein [Dehalococcoidia bacterium]